MLRFKSARLRNLLPYQHGRRSMIFDAEFHLVQLGDKLAFEEAAMSGTVARAVALPLLVVRQQT